MDGDITAWRIRGAIRASIGTLFPCPTVVGWYAVIAGVRFTCIATLGVDDSGWRGGTRVGTPLTVSCGIDGGGCCGGTGVAPLAVPCGDGGGFCG